MSNMESQPIIMNVCIILIRSIDYLSLGWQLSMQIINH